MARYALKRLAWTVVVLWAIMTLTFGAVFLSPVDPAKAYAGARASTAVVEQTREEFGLDDPLIVQYGRYLGRTITGDLGTSFFTGRPVLDSTLDRLPLTALLAFAGVFVALVVGLPLGLAAALKRGTAVDRGILGFSLLGIVTPAFVLGFLLLYFLAFELGWFPLGGSGSFMHLVLPAIALGLPAAAWYARMLRSTVLNITGEDYIRNARAKGLSERVVVGRHVMRNAVGPIITMVGIDLGVFLAGVLVIEKVFGWPGLGEQAWRAISNNDIPLVMGTVLIAAFFVAIFNLLADLVNAAVDPRAKYA
jgi:peptide/nickel transport system permease protein